MILARGFPGIAFTEVSDGDLRHDMVARRTVSDILEIPHGWAVANQVHGSHIAVAHSAGNLGEADGIVTSVAMLPIAVSIADCVPVAIVGTGSVAVVHAGWRGVASGVVGSALHAMDASGGRVLGAVIGPHIGPCCFEVGPEVVDAVGGHATTTSEGSLSVDLASAIRDQLGGIEIESGPGCTMHDDRFYSHRRNATRKRQMAVAWISQD
jgi:YfiH family protein